MTDALTSKQRNAIFASYLGWTLDAFDFFILVFVLKDIAGDFGAQVKDVAFAITLTLMMRPIGAFLFGMLADRFGRRPVLMADVLAYSVLELASGFAPSLGILLVLRALYGIAMGGEWGVGASLTLESVPARRRGLVSGILQAGYPSGYLLAALVFATLYPVIGWRGMFFVGALPALLVLYIRRHVEESPAFTVPAEARQPLRTLMKGKGPIFLWAVIMMASFNFLSHGTQDLYPTFLLQQRHLTPRTVGLIAIIYNIGAICGGLIFGALSEKIGRKKAIVAAALLVLPAIPLWAGAKSVWALALGAFLIQFFAQGAWGVVPVHLNEISPAALRGTFPGFAYQLGNLLAAANATLQAGFAATHGGDYALALGVVAALAAVAVALVAGFGIERRGKDFSGGNDSTGD